MEAIVLAGGKGTRLLPYTADFPKPLVPLDGMPILEIIVRQLKHCGISSVILALKHKHDLISSYFGDGTALGIEISYLVEDEPMGTCGSVFAVLDKMSSNFLVMNSDVLTDLNFRNLIDHHCKSDSTLTVATHRRECKIDYGVIEINDTGSVTGLLEKPLFVNNIVMGIYVLSKERIRTSRRDGPIDMPELINKLIASGEKVSSYAETCAWIDVGTPENYVSANTLFSENRRQFLSGGKPSRATRRR